MVKRNRTKVYKLDTLNNTVLAEYSSITNCSWNEDSSYRTIWNQCNQSITGNGGFINTPYYFSKTPQGAPHDIIVAEYVATGKKRPFINIVSAELATGISRNTITRHLKSEHTSFNTCGIKFYKEAVE